MNTQLFLCHFLNCLFFSYLVLIPQSLNHSNLIVCFNNTILFHTYLKEFKNCLLMLLINSLICFCLLIQNIGMICGRVVHRPSSDTQQVFNQHHSPLPPSLRDKGPSGKRSFTLRTVNSLTNFLWLLKNACVCTQLYKNHYILFQFQETSIIFKSKWVQFINEKITASFCLFGSYTGECECMQYVYVNIHNIHVNMIIVFKLHIIPNLVNLFNL